MKKPILIIKVGTSSITTKSGVIDETVVAEICRQIANLSETYRVALVSSGAVGAGKKYLKNYTGALNEKKAAAAVGNPLLIGTYARHMAPHRFGVAQTLHERAHFARRHKLQQLEQTYHTLWENDIVPIANENDVVSDTELKFSDNDELSTLLAIALNANKLLIGTSVPGVFDAKGNTVAQITEFTDEVLGLAHLEEKSEVGLGGMITKLACAHLATNMGIEVMIFATRGVDGILQAAEGRTGTRCVPQKCDLNQRRKWLASGCVAVGRLVVDTGAAAALRQRKSLLAVGIAEIQGDFSAGDVCSVIETDSRRPFAVARVKLSAKELQNRHKETKLIVAHADEIVILR